MFYKSKKFWTAVFTLLGTLLAHHYGEPELRDAVALIGSVLVGGWGLADVGKEAAKIKEGRS